MKYLSTSALAKERQLDSKELFKKLKAKGWIYRKDDSWQLTKNGRVAGGDTKYNPKFGEYVVWPFNLNIEMEVDSNNLLNATKIGDHFNVSNRKVNSYFSDLGWIQKDRDGWITTKPGIKNGGHQMELKNGVPFVLWDNEVLTNKHLIRTIGIGEGTQEDNDSEIAEKDKELIDIRKKYPAEKRTSDGHYVRSRAELLIDNFFYRNGIVHAYEKKLNIEEVLYCDFYLPENKIYIEYWGMEDDKKYLARKKRKLELYAQNGFTLVELNDSDVENLEENLESKLRKVGLVIN
ncbi:hypothetical protein [Winogradskyella forsetii]|uniref:hypothetical protein n=1 Tax=Winogradskyella forsetii TaxID=2686077 RepID=UPI001E5E1C4C|nr:hypothetical protein [Winogradskyella forsetii]